MNINDQIDKYKGFKLISLYLRGNSLMGKCDLNYNFIDDIDKKDIFYTTVFIGANGTGKSNLFRIIIELFKELYDLSLGKSRSYKVDGFFNLKYSLNGCIYEYSNYVDFDTTFNDVYLKSDFFKKKNAFLNVNGLKTDFKDAFLPLSIVANSIMITDKFPFYRNGNDENDDKLDLFPIYNYLGVRNTPQSTSTRAYVRKTVEFIVNQFKNNESQILGFISVLKRATMFLELDNSIEILYYTSNNSLFFKGHLTIEKLSKYFEDIHAKYNSLDKAPFKVKHFLKIKRNQKLLESICFFCNQLVNDNILQKIPNKKTSIKKITYNLSEEKQLKKLISDYKLLEYLRLLGILNPPDIELKRGDGFSLQESSSGEYQFFSSIVGLMATVKPTNSLVFIDEPEISLHPNWQMKYFAFLRELFSHEEYSTCHIFVATHSHFLISDLKGDSSKIIGLKREGKEIKIIDLPKELNTYGWSAENILLNVFNVPTTRNYYIADQIGEILELVSQKDRNEELIHQKVNILIKKNVLTLSENDPLKFIWQKLVSKYGN